MAIQFRRGAYKDFDPSKLQSGEPAVVLSGDPNSSSGRSVYICFEPGVVKRFTTYEDFETELQAATSDIREEFTDYLQGMIDTAVAAAVQNAIAATGSANDATDAAQAAAASAAAAAERADAAAAACEGLPDNTRVTALETKMQQVIAILANALSTE